MIIPLPPIDKVFFFGPEDPVIYKPMVGIDPGIDSASIPPSFIENVLEKFISMVLGFLEKSLEHRIPPKWSLVAPAAPKWILGNPQLPPT